MKSKFKYFNLIKLVQTNRKVKEVRKFLNFIHHNLLMFSKKKKKKQKKETTKRSITIFGARFRFHSSNGTTKSLKVHQLNDTLQFVSTLNKHSTITKKKKGRQLDSVSGK